MNRRIMPLAPLGYGLLVLVAIWLMAYAMVSREYQQTVREIEQNNNQLVRAYEEHVRRSLHSVEEQMMLIKAEYERAGVTAAITTILERAASNPLIVQILLLNSKGEIITSILPGTSGATFNDRSYFQAHIAADSQRTFISEPIVGRITNKKSTYFSRRLNTKAGSFAGTVVMAVDSSYFTDFYLTMGLKPGQIVRMVGLEGIVRASSNPDEIGQMMWNSDLFELYLREKKQGSYFTTGHRFGIPRYFSYRTMPDFPLIVQVGLAAQPALAEYRTRRNFYWGAAIVSSFLVILLSSLSLLNALQQRQKDERWRLVVEGVNDGVWDWDARTDRIFFSDRCKEILGHNPDESGDTREEWIARCHPDDLDRVQQAIEAHKNGRSPHYNEIHRLRCKDGSYKWVRSRGKVLRDEAGTVVRMIGALTDIDAEKQAANALRQSELALKDSRDKYKSLIEQSSEAIVLLDPQKHEIVEINSKFSEWFGYRLPEDAPLTTDKILTDEVEKQDEYFRTLCHDGNLPVKRRTFRHKNGSLLFMERSVTLAKHEERPMVMITYRNIAEQLQQEQNRRQDAAIAQRIQRAQLSELLTSEYVQVETAFQPYAEVSGDLYHLEWLNEGQLLRGYLLDVPGHGLTTALYTSTLKVLLHEVAEQDASLTDQVRWLNKQVCRFFESNAFAAAIAFELDLQLRELRCVGAGITRFWVDMSAGRGPVQIPGLYLGIDEQQSYGLQTLPLATGDRICFATDGLESMLLAAEGRRIEDCDQFSSLLSTITETSTQKDDIAAVCIRIKSLPQALMAEGWPKTLRLNGFEDYRRFKGEVAKVLAEVTGQTHSLEEVAVNEAIANALECRDGKARNQRAILKFSRFGHRFVVRVKTSRIGFAGNAVLSRLRANPELLFAFGEDASMGRGIPLMLSLSDRMTYNHDGTEVLLSWKVR